MNVVDTSYLLERLTNINMIIDGVSIHYSDLTYLQRVVNEYKHLNKNRVVTFMELDSESYKLYNHIDKSIRAVRHMDELLPAIKRNIDKIVHYLGIETGRLPMDTSIDSLKINIRLMESCKYDKYLDSSPMNWAKGKQEYLGLLDLSTYSVPRSSEVYDALIPRFNLAKLQLEAGIEAGEYYTETKGKLLNFITMEVLKIITEYWINVGANVELNKIIKELLERNIAILNIE